VTKISPIRIHHADSDTEVEARHRRIEARLDELGAEEVRSLVANGGLATQWSPIIRAWSSGKRLAPDEKAIA
jgi:hypothetical protein